MIKLFFILFFQTLPARAVVQTETHTYIEGQRYLLITDRTTDHETFIDIGFETHPIVIHQDRGYLLGVYGDLAVLDLKSHQIIKTIPSFIQGFIILNPPHIHKDTGYVHCSTNNSKNCYIIAFDLSTLQCTFPYTLEDYSYKMVVRGEKGYSVSCEDNTRTLTIFDFAHKKSIVQKLPLRPMSQPVFWNTTGYIHLDATDPKKDIIQTFDRETGVLGKTYTPGCKLSSHPMLVWGKKGYVPDIFQGRLIILDLETGKHDKRIDLRALPTGLKLCNDMIYIFHNDAKSLMRFNPKDEVCTYGQIMKRLDFAFIGTYAVVVTETPEVILLSLDTFESIHRYPLPHPYYYWKDRLHVSNGKVYLNTRKIFPKSGDPVPNDK